MSEDNDSEAEKESALQRTDNTRRDPRRRDNSRDNSRDNGGNAGNGGSRGRSFAGGAEDGSKLSAAGLLGKVVERSMRADPKLKQHLTGRILIEIASENNARETAERYLFDWRGNTLTIEPSNEMEIAKAPVGGLPAAADAASISAVDCLLRFSFESLRRIFFGELNPQVAMLSSLIEVQGQTHFAIYFFNLVVPQTGDNHARA